MSQSMPLRNVLELPVQQSTTESKLENQVTDTSDVDFSSFWLLYPRRIARLAALKAWSRLSDQQKIDAVCGVAAWRRVWATKDPEYIPHAATWLNGWRWEDEIPAGFSGTGSAAHDPAKPLPARTGMPEHVRALLAKLRSNL